MRISDWSSDVCSSDLSIDDAAAEPEEEEERDDQAADPEIGRIDAGERLGAHCVGHHRAFLDLDPLQEEMGADQRADESAEAVEGLAERQAEKIGRASCREREGQYV